MPWACPVRANQSDTGCTWWPLRVRPSRTSAGTRPSMRAVSTQDVAGIDRPVHEARPLDRLLDLHAVVEDVGEPLGVEHGLAVAAHRGVAQDGQRRRA